VARHAVGKTFSAPPFLRLAAHPVRWGLLLELAHSDRQVRELTQLIGRPQNLVSYHLGRLRATQLVTMRRSSADARDAYYSVNLSRCRDLLSTAGAALHPGLRLVPPADDELTVTAAGIRVLFLCTGNSARSQMAEALLRRLSHNALAPFSAGSHPKRLHPNAVRVMRQRGIDITGQRVKHLNEFVAQRFDYVISLCDRVREVCPEFPGHPEVIHWSMADPAAEGSSDEETLPAFERTAAELDMRIQFFIQLVQSTQLRKELN
jgi:protein-tyrosine-phosphatase